MITGLNVKGIESEKRFKTSLNFFTGAFKECCELLHLLNKDKLQHLKLRFYEKKTLGSNTLIDQSIKSISSKDCERVMGAFHQPSEEPNFADLNEFSRLQVDVFRAYMEALRGFTNL